MKEYLKPLGIYITSFVSYAAFTVISPFYPAVAIRQGVPEYLIGPVFSVFPIGSLLISPFLPSLMFSLGKTPILLLGLLFIGTSNLLISFLESFSPLAAILASFLSRAFSGVGSALSIVSSTAILASDYPNDFSRLIAMVECYSGVGVIAGPTLGSLLFAHGGFESSCRILGLAVFIWTPVAFWLIGKSSPYKVTENEDVGMIHVAKKPVSNRQKILATALMPFFLMLAVGVNLPTLEMHLLRFGVKEEDIGFALNVLTVGYMVGSYALSKRYRVRKCYVIAAGLFLYAVGYSLVGPFVIMPQKLWIVLVGLHLIGWAGSLIYGN
jgi:MFS family permease